MADLDFGAWLKFPISLACFICLLVSFYLTWVTDGASTWGLWKWCKPEEKNATEKNATDEEQHERCYNIEPGESPVYFEVVRALAVISLALYILQSLCCVVPKKYAEGDHHFTPNAVVTLLASVSTGITLLIVGLLYKEDERWKDANPSLDRGFWLAAATAASNIFFMCVCPCAWCQKCKCGKPTRIPHRIPPSIIAPPRRLSNASTISIESNKKMTIFFTEICMTEVDKRASQRPEMQTVTDHLRYILSPVQIGFQSQDSQNVIDPEHPQTQTYNSARDLENVRTNQIEGPRVVTTNTVPNSSGDAIETDHRLRRPEIKGRGATQAGLPDVNSSSAKQSAACQRTQSRQSRPELYQTYL